ncbi:hypothetical protein EMIT040CA3_130018 [Bacillus pseudomycoides]
MDKIYLFLDRLLGLTPVKWTAVKKDYAAIEIRYSIGARWLSLFWNRL